MDSMMALEALIEKTKREKSGEKASQDLHSSSDDSHSHGNVSPRAKNSVDIGDYLMKPLLEFVNSKYTYKNVVFFMQEELEILKRWSRDQSFMLSFVHGKFNCPNKEIAMNMHYSRELTLIAILGDLNLQNIMVDENHNIWLIDFFFTTKAHVWKDILKVTKYSNIFPSGADLTRDIFFSQVENDIMYCETSIYDADQLEEALAITEAYRINEYVLI